MMLTYDKSYDLCDYGGAVLQRAAVFCSVLQFAAVCTYDM